MFPADQGAGIVKIGVVTSSYPLSPLDTVTAGVFVRDLALEFVSLGHQVHVITPRKHGTVILDDGLCVKFIPWWGGEKDLASASMRNPFTAGRYATLVGSGLWTVPRYVRKRGLDALVAMWAIPSGLWAWIAGKRTGVPYGVWALGSDIWARHKYPFGDAIVRRVLRDAGFCFADGVELARKAAELAGHECEFVPSVRRLPTHTELRIALEPGVPHFLYIGRYEWNKGPDILIEAMRLLLDGGDTAYLHLFGVGSLEPVLRERIKGYEHYILLGGYAEPSTAVAYMQACDWLVIPSRIESIPLVLGDALHMQLPVVATDVGDVGKLVCQYGVGVVVPPQAPLALAEALRQAMQCNRAEFGEALEKAANQFDLSQSAARCIEAVSVAARHRR
jgi:glycosyltransferase involved in cell wall biosynthesis